MPSPTPSPKANGTGPVPGGFAAAPRGGAEAMGLDEMITALRTIPHGGIDDTARNLALPPQIRATISPLIMSMRWAAAMFGMIFGTKAALTGDLDVVFSLGVCLFLTTWRTTLPIKLASRRTADRMVAFTDTALFAMAAGFSGGPRSPFVFCVITAVAVAAFGWGYLSGFVAMFCGVGAMIMGMALHGSIPGVGDRLSLSIAGAFLVAVLIPGLIRSALLDVERRRIQITGRLDALVETNDLLTMLNALARTLPTSLNLREALDNAHLQISQTFHPSVVCLMELDETSDEWVPKLAEGCVLKPSSESSELPGPLRRVMNQPDPQLAVDLTDTGQSISPNSGSGLYVRLHTRNRTVGLLGIEHPEPGHFAERDVRLLAGMADVLALSLDNARWFGRLRSLGAEQERTRIARDLHDRLGQWLTYISFELERIITGEDTSTPELSRLYGDVQTALDELRETLRQLRSGVTEDQPLSRVGKEIVDRFTERTEVEVSWSVTDPEQSLPVPIENELLRILQESLSNIDKHAQARHVDVVWQVIDGRGVLTVTDDGRGFDAATGVRDSAYGLVGMRERADVIGARLTIESSPGHGTTIVVTAGSSSDSRST